MAAGSVNYQQAVMNGGRPALHHPIPGNMWTEGLSTADRPQKKLFVGCLTSHQHASVSQGPICTDNFTCCHTEVKAADQTFYLIQSHFTDAGPTSPRADPTTPGAWQGSHWEYQFLNHWPRKIPSQAGFEHRIFRSRGGRLNYKSNEAVRRRRMSSIVGGEEKNVIHCWR